MGVYVSNTSQTRDIFEINERFHYSQKESIGQGTFGQVFKGYDSKMGKIIAVKVIKKQKDSKNLKREIAILQALSQRRHPNIVTYYGAIETDKHLFLIMELCQGGALSDLLKNEGKIAEYRVVKIFRQILSAMAYMNQQKIMHRDLKPDNILFDENGNVKIVDFGIARSFQQKMNLTGGRCTALYGAPQMVRLQEQYDQKCDIWSAGAVLYQMLTGKKIIDVRNVNNWVQLALQVSEKFKGNQSKVEIPPELERQWQTILNCMIRYNPQERKSFKEIYNYFTAIEKDLKKSIAKKEQMKKQKLSEQYRVSQNILNRVEKWIRFIRKKNLMYTSLINVFREHKYNIMENFYKYILMFLSGMILLAKFQDSINQFEKKHQRTLNGHKIDMEIVIPNHRAKISKIMNEEKVYLQKLSKNYKEKYLKPEILPQLMKYLRQERFNKRLLGYKNLQQVIREVNQQVYHPEYIYRNLYQMFTSTQPIFIASTQYSILNLTQLYVYFRITLIQNLDKAFPDSNFENEDFLSVKGRKIVNFSDFSKWEQKKLRKELEQTIDILRETPKQQQRETEN